MVVNKTHPAQTKRADHGSELRFSIRLMYIYCICSRCLKHPCMTPSISVCSAVDLHKMRWRYAKQQFDTNVQKLCWIVTVTKLKHCLTGFHFLNVGITSVHGSSSKVWHLLCFSSLSTGCRDVLRRDDNLS